MGLAPLNQQPECFYSVKYDADLKTILVHYKDMLIGTCLAADELIDTYFERHNNVFYVSFRHGTYIGTRVFAYNASEAIQELCASLTEAFALMFSQHETGFRVIAKPNGVYVTAAGGQALLKSVRVDKATKDVIVDDFNDTQYISKYIGDLAKKEIPITSSEIFELPPAPVSGENTTSLFSQQPVKYPKALEFAALHGSQGNVYKVFAVDADIQVVVASDGCSAVIKSNHLIDIGVQVCNVWKFTINLCEYLGISYHSGGYILIMDLKTFQIGKIPLNLFRFIGDNSSCMKMYAYGESLDPVICIRFDSCTQIETASGNVYACDDLNVTYDIFKGE